MVAEDDQESIPNGVPILSTCVYEPCVRYLLAGPSLPENLRKSQANR